jgi:hypothetical protein
VRTDLPIVAQVDGGFGLLVQSVGRSDVGNNHVDSVEPGRGSREDQALTNVADFGVRFRSTGTDVDREILRAESHCVDGSVAAVSSPLRTPAADSARATIGSVAHRSSKSAARSATSAAPPTFGCMIESTGHHR